MKMPLPILVDCYTILKLKMDRFSPEQKEKEPHLETEFKIYHDIIQKYRGQFAALDNWVNELYKINGRIWDLEWEIRQGKDGKFALEEIGRRALLIRDINRERNIVKNKIVKETGAGFPDYKIGHASEIFPKEDESNGANTTLA